MNAGDLVRYLKRESTVEETSLLATEQDKCQGEKKKPHRIKQGYKRTCLAGISRVKC